MKNTKKFDCLVKSYLLAGLLVSGQVSAQTPAFPGALGFGANATGGRAGTVYHVTNLNDSGAGSLRDAVSASGRTVVFDVGGRINIIGRIVFKNNVTVAGQTAPGDGICVYGNGVSFSGANNSITRFIRFRMGENGDAGKDAVALANGHDMIFDHTSISWGVDENFSVNNDPGVTIVNITLQNSIVSQGLQTHSAGGLIQTGGGVSIYRCLYIDNDTRNPKVKFVNEFVNNVVANWETIGYNMGGDSAGDSYANAFNNYFIRGPNSSSSAFGGGNLNFHIYATNNWVDSNKNGILDGSEWPIANYGSMDLQSVPYAYPITNAVPPLTALKFAISDVGASPRRDIVDERLMTELTSWGSLGETISSEYGTPMSGPGVINGGVAPTDTDQDGMPDYWENGTGSDPNVANNNDPSPSGSGYTRLEDYINWLAEPHGFALTNTACDVELRQFTRGFTNFNPIFSVANATNGTVSLSVNGLRAHFVPTPGYTGPAGFTFTVTDSDGSTVTRQMNLFFTPTATNTSFTWRGDALTNNWNALGDLNWFDGYSLLFPFHNGDTVTFDDSGFASPNLNLTGSLQPASVTVSAAQNYTLGGSGSLDGTMTLLKAGAGIFRLNNTNNFSGTTTVSNGTLLVNGALVQSAVTVLSGGSAGGGGCFGNGITAQSGGSVIAGDGIGVPGTLTITNALTENGSVINRLDLSDDPTGLVKTNDQIRVIGDLNLSGVNTIQVNLLNGPLVNGDYVLFTYTGALSGSLANLTVVGANGTLTSSDGQILLHVNNTRAPASLVWVGGLGGNTWDVGTNGNWLNGALLDWFYFGDTVRFDDSDSTSPAMNLVGTLTPASVTVDSTHNYTFSGTGKISGTGVFTKTNSGTLTVTTANDFTGPVVIGGSGVLAVSRLANGGVASSLGAASSDPTNLVFYGGTLRYTGSSVATDRRATLNSNATLDVASGTLTANGPLAGSGALIKAGAGILAIPTNNAHTGGVIISNGTVNLTTTTARDGGLGTGTTTLSGGTLQLFGYGGGTGTDFGTFNRPLNVIFGTTNALLTPPRYTMSSALTGSGTLNLTVDYVRGSLNGNWSAFAGTINVFGRAAPSEFRVANTLGYGNAAVFINDNVIISRSGSGITIEFGSLGGTSGSVVGPGNQSSSGSSYRVGGNNQDATFAGQLQADGVNTFTKVGAGNWTLTGANSYTGGTVVNGGTLTVDNTSGSGTGTAAVTVNTGATLAGNGIISGAVTINSGATNAPGTGIGTLTVNNNVTLAAGSTTRIEINRTTLTKDLLDASGTLTYGGTLIVTNLSGTLGNGDSFKIFDAATYTGSFTSSNLPPLAGGLSWNISTLATSGTISVVGTNAPGAKALVWKGDGAANAWDINTTPNWLDTNNAAAFFTNFDSVTFNDNGSNNVPVVLATAVQPASLTVNATRDYIITGIGAINGTNSLTKSGTGTLTLTTSNGYTGGTTINAGSLKLLGLGAGLANRWSFNNSLADSVGGSTATIVDVGANNVTLGASDVTLAGGIRTNSDYISLGANLLPNSTAPVTIELWAKQNTVQNWARIFDFGSSSAENLYMSWTIGTTLTQDRVQWKDGVTSTADNSNQPYTLGTEFHIAMVIEPGAGAGGTTRVTWYSAASSSASLGTAHGTFDSANTLAAFSNPNCWLGRSEYTGDYTASASYNEVRIWRRALSAADLQLLHNAGPDAVMNVSLSAATAVNLAGATAKLENLGGAQTIASLSGVAGSEVKLTSGSLITGVANASTTFAGFLSGTNGLTKTGTGTFTLSGGNTCTGATTLSNGTLLVNGSLAGTLTAKGGTLGGSGAIAGATTISSGATLAPGNSIGTLTFSNSLTLSAGSTNMLEISKAPLANDAVNVLGSLNLGGALVVTNISGFALAAGDSFPLFNAPALSGSFSSLTVPALGTNLAWDTNSFLISGTLTVISTAPPAFNFVAPLGDGNFRLTFSGPAGQDYELRATTNLMLTPVTLWDLIGSGTFGNDPVIFDDLSATNNPQKFYRLLLP